MKKTGILGGSFDPLHLGHCIIALDAMEQLGLDEVIFMPSALSPLKPEAPSTQDHHRLAMMEAALYGWPNFTWSDWEIRHGGTSYTIDTVKHLVSSRAGERLFWIIGGDQLFKLNQWKSIDQLGELIEFICVDRPCYSELPPPSLPGSVRVHRVVGHPFAISSSEIRQRFEVGLPTAFFLPIEVSVYIKNHQLYRSVN
jgi:nicotinate-nucleotide adenylyltransferase